MTQRLAEILAEMVMASLDAKERRAPRVERCSGCPYGSEPIGSSGNPASPIAIVGEAPGQTEVRQGRPFVGPAGTTLRRAIEEASLGEFDPFITNSVSCLPNPVAPRVEAIDACRGRLMRELEAYPRTVVVAVGGTALRALTETRKPRILEARAGPPIKVHGWLVVPTVHPAWVRRDPHEREKLLIGDLWRARGLLDAGHLRTRLQPGAPDLARGDADATQAPSESRPLTRSSLGGESKVTSVSLGSGPENPKIAPANTSSRMAGQPRYRGRRGRSAISVAFVPDPVGNLQVLLPGDAVLEVSLAEAEIRALSSLPKTEGFEAIGSLLLRAESIASSRIEGIELSQRSFALALLEQEASDAAKSAMGNVRAMQETLQLGSSGRQLTVADITDIHRSLLLGTDQSEIAGYVRTVQNWIGGRLNSPLDAEFVPPPPAEVPRLLDDLVAFVNREDLPAVAQAAIAHAQFETIHPFSDGNGRVGRCLIQLVLRRRGLAPTLIPPVSVVLATNPKAYIRGLTGYREGAITAWCSSFSIACRVASQRSEGLAGQIATLIGDWRGRAGSPRRGSAGSKLIELLAHEPIASVSTAHAAIGGSAEAVRLALNSLTERGIVRQITAGRYARAWAADELFELLDEYERSFRN